MSTDHAGQAPAGDRMVVLPDLDTEFTAALAEVEELLMTLRWQETGDPDDLVAHPPALGGGVALQALRRVADTVRSTQTNPEASTGGRLLGPDGRYEHVPLQFVRMRAADIDALSAAAAALGEPVRTEAVTDALRLHAGHRAQDRKFPDPDAALVALVARVAGVLDLEWTRDTELLRDRLEQPDDAAGDVVLTVAEETAYERVVTRFNRMWTLADPGRTPHLLTASAAGGVDAARTLHPATSLQVVPGRPGAAVGAA